MVVATTEPIDSASLQGRILATVHCSISIPLSFPTDYSPTATSTILYPVLPLLCVTSFEIAVDNHQQSFPLLMHSSARTSLEKYPLVLRWMGLKGFNTLTQPDPCANSVVTASFEIAVDNHQQSFPLLIHSSARTSLAKYPLVLRWMGLKGFNTLTQPDPCANNGVTAGYLNGEDYEGGFDKDAIESMLSAIESNFKTWAPGFASLVVGDKDPVSVEKFTRTLQRMRPEVALSLARTVFLSDLRDVLENVEVPCSIIQCSNDVVVPVSVARYMERKIKGQASVEIIDTHGHFPQLTAHEKLLETIHRLLNITSNS
ncbi:hypothetical protein J5N97_013342 [Dioscorea zingiberensis]|uniref:AB hydrolase-1 domain-containing protein n=1 Tax=Dioscorea zingiberensis TaxID=325984 RepID=A0A9D5HIQ5_9LILI|nr:hypothetical protein J5N97_013342 [Dioscorea zingiberensis]